ncbi:zinc finger protein MAGPIE [Apium graveolens]|uniref:zinc finger protein MAGPIE n=1 Tax=Apium graveolens TaxID=4045 RepID=UPI003D7B443A
MLEQMTDEVISNSFIQNQIDESNPPPAKKKRNLPGTPDPEAEVIALSPKTLMATNRFLCEICGKGFQRDQNLQLHRRGHNLPWKLKQRTSKEIRKRVYVCPEKSCVHNHPSRALGDLTGIKKHYCRKHGEKKWKCGKCAKRYAVQSDWKAHSKTCGTREYKCDCGTIFSRRDSFITHRAFCEALAEETARVTAATSSINNSTLPNMNYHFMGSASSLGQNTAQHFSSIFEPVMSSNHELLTDPIRQAGLSLWMGHDTTQNSHAAPLNLQPLFSDPKSSYQFNWASTTGNNRINIPSPFDEQQKMSIATTTNSLPVVNNIVTKDVGNQLVSIPSLYSSQNMSDQCTLPATMSATALLQKAAQIGATSTTDPSFLESFGMKRSNINQVQDGSKFFGLFGTNLMTTTSLGNTTTDQVNDHLSNLNHHLYPSKRRHIQQDQDSSGSGETRDFLGVGVRSICQTPSINGWI